MSIPFEVIELDKTRKLRFGTAAFMEAEKKLGKSIFKIDYTSLGVTEIAILLYAGLRWEDKSLTFDNILEMLDDRLDNIGDVINKVIDAVISAFPSLKGESKNVETPEAARELITTNISN